MITINARPPRIDIKPRTDIASAPPSEDILTKWKAGIRPVNQDTKNIIKIDDVIGYDWWTGGGITEKSVSTELAKFNDEPCEVQINSPGGDMFEGIAIYNTLRQYKGKITVKVLALAASAASIIAMAGDERLMGEGAFIMIHNAWVIAIGNRHDMQECADYLEPFDYALRDIYARRTGEKASKIENWMDEETFFSAEQAIKLGFATALMSKDSLTEDPAATKAAAQFNSVRKVESLLTKEGGMSRSQARALLQEIKGGKPDAAARENSGTQDAAAAATHDAGNNDWIKGALALSQSLKA
ncbi:hypothetical protein BLN97_26535 [Bradyrhizobium elkanii]|nr:hypothetical protein BLN97_26535 [Bradyrhizobium elkanii]